MLWLLDDKENVFFNMLEYSLIHNEMTTLVIRQWPE
jgi:hypothetical protein